MGLEYDPASKLYRGIPNASHLKDILRLGAQNGRTVPGGANCDGFLAYIYALKAMKIFSHCSMYSMAGKISVRADALPDVAHASRTSQSFIPTMTAASTDTVAIPALMTDTIVFTALMKEPAFIPLTRSQKIQDYSVKPSGSVSFGQGGLVFPYFKGMVLPDREFAASIFNRYFFRGLGSNEKIAADYWIRVKSGLRQISNLSCGMMISHALMGMHLADQTKSTIRYIIEKGTYHGFVLIGDHIKIINTNRVVSAVTEQELIDAIPKVLGVDQAITKLIAKIHEVKLIDKVTPRYQCDINEMKSSRSIFNKLRTIDTDYFSRSELDEIDLILQDITFGETYLPITPASLSLFIAYVSTGDLGLLSDHPTLLTHKLWRTTDRVSIGLAAFGPTVPTISFGVKPKAAVIEIPLPSVADTVSTMGGAYPTMPIKVTSFRGGVDFWQPVFGTGVILLPHARPGKKEKYDLRGISAHFTGVSFQNVWGQLKQSVADHRAANAGKRKRGMEDEGPSAKKGKLPERAPMDLSEM